MSILHIQWSKDLRKYCEKLGRAGMYNRAKEIAEWMLKEDRTPQEVMMAVGKLQALAVGSKCDGYWNEKVQHGYHQFLDESKR